MRARRAAVAAATPWIGTTDIAQQLDVSPRSVRHLRGQSVARHEVVAVVLQLQLRAALRAAR